MISGIPSNDNDENASPLGGNEGGLSEEDLAHTRVVVMTASRKSAFKMAWQFDTEGGKYCFGTEDGNSLIQELPTKISAALRRKTLPSQFDALFGLTFMLDEHDYWIRDNELWEVGGRCDRAIKLLAKAWKKLLTHSDDELGECQLRQRLHL